MLLETVPRSVRQSVVMLFPPVLRTCLKHVSLGTSSELLWKRVMVPYFEWRSYDFTARTRFGSRIVGNTGDLIQKWICYCGVWEPGLTNWIAQRLLPGDTFVDVGANIGYFSLLASKLVGRSGKVVAIEASPRIFALLKRNLDCNHVENVRAVNVAVWDSEASLQLFSGPERNLAQTTVTKAWADRYQCKPDCEVRAMPLTALLEPDEIRAVRVIKVDVEGGEWHVASSMVPILASCRPDLEIVMEMTPGVLADEGKTCEDLIALFTPFGFHAYTAEPDSFQDYFRQKSVNAVKRLRHPVAGVEQAQIVLSRTDADCI
jgi:FkbM family methyltransferase